MARLPQPPLGKTPNDLHRSLTDIISFMRETFDNGAKHPGFSQTQIDSFTDLSFLGTILFNTDTNESNIAYLDGSVVNWRAV
jgi:prepilin-type processing-associated H-X9-DG protein